MASLGAVKTGKQFAVVDYSKEETVFSRLLSKKDLAEYEKTQKLPVGVTAKKQHVVIEYFPTLQEAKQFIRSGAKGKPDTRYGVFKSKAQWQLAKKKFKQ